MQPGESSGEAGDAGGDAGDGGANPKPSNRWKLLVPSNFPRRSQPHSNNCDLYTKYDVVFQHAADTRGFMPGHSGGKEFKVRRQWWRACFAGGRLQGGAHGAGARGRLDLVREVIRTGQRHCR